MSDLKQVLQEYKASKDIRECEPALIDKKRKLNNTDVGSSKILEDVNADKLNNPNNAIPHFLIIGAQKAGTMAAVKNLNKHPEIHCLSEVHYFDLGWHSKDKSWYKSQFISNTKPIQGEKTPELIYMDECAIRIKETCPNAKFILFIREPIARAYSAWNMNKNKNRETLPFEESIQRNIDNVNEIRSYGTGEYHYLQRGMYMDQIERFHSVFPDKSNLLVVIAERIHSNPSEEYSRIFKFLGANPNYSFIAEDEHVGSYSTSMSSKTEEKLKRFFRSHNERLYQYLGYRIIEWDPSKTSIQPSKQTVIATSELPECSIIPTVSEESNSVVATACESIDYQQVLTSSIGKNVEEPTLQITSVKETGSFAVLGKSNGTDKITHHGTQPINESSIATKYDGYHRFYPRFIEHYRSITNSAMLEIGIDRSNSLNMWLEYFPLAFIYGIDINLASKGQRFEIFKADQSQRNAMKMIFEHNIKHHLFLIIDDGSHIPEHQVQCFDYLFCKALQPGGTYIVEDIETSYWTRNGLYGYTTRYGYHHERSAIEVFKDVLDDINREFLTDENRKTQEKRVGNDISLETRKQISTVTFGQNCIIITKKCEDEYQYDNRIYRFKKNL